VVEREDRRAPSPRPGIAIAEQGAVILEGPQGAVATLTPEAAATTSENLRQAARLAALQRSENPASDPVLLHPKDETS
jgi:hypothetical protein